jgi:hypothetical protein
LDIRAGIFFPQSKNPFGEMIYFLAKRAMNKSRCFITIIIITHYSLTRDIFFRFFPKINLFTKKAIHKIK